MTSPSDEHAELLLADLMRFSRDSVVAQGLFLGRIGLAGNGLALLVILAALVGGSVCAIAPLAPLLLLFGAGALACLAGLAGSHFGGLWFLRSIAMQHRFAAGLINPAQNPEVREATRELLAAESNRFMSASSVWPSLYVAGSCVGCVLFIVGILAPLIAPEVLGAVCPKPAADTRLFP
ncbi:MAG TPA: hypothetical protein PLN53_08730 [Terricaulis sp.]|nr:hypothetical protein [Terricaulis sp.]